jgi:hypothetical protein
MGVCPRNRPSCFRTCVCLHVMWPLTLQFGVYWVHRGAFPCSACRSVCQGLGRAIYRSPDALAPTSELHTIKFLYNNVHLMHHKYNKPEEVRQALHAWGFGVALPDPKHQMRACLLLLAPPPPPPSEQMSPYCSIAFHPLDGILQASPYVVFTFLVPTHYLTSLLMMFYTGIWASNIHVRVPSCVLLLFSRTLTSSGFCCGKKSPRSEVAVPCCFGLTRTMCLVPRSRLWVQSTTR